MSGLHAILNSALRSMEVSMQSLSVASNNIANENTPGYAKQRLVLETAGSNGTGLLIGRGVRAVTIEAMRDALVDSRLQQESSNMAGSEIVRDALRDIEVLFNDAAETGMLPVITDFFNAFHALALDTASVNAREEVRIAAEDVARSFRTRGEELRRIQDLANQSIAEDVNKINSLGTEIAALSAEIAREEAAGQNSNDLRTARSERVRRLAELVDVRELDGGSSYNLVIGGSGMLVFDGRTAGATTQVSATTGLLSVKVGPVEISPSAGKIYGQQQVRDKYMPDYIGKLDQLAYEIADQVNQIHTAAYDRSGNSGVDFFTPLTTSADAARLIDLGAAIKGDLSKIATAVFPNGTDNEAATGIGNLLHVKNFTGGSVVDQYRSLVFAVGNDTANAKGRLNQHEALLNQLEGRRDSISGVSVDEETMKIVEFQRAYQASANLIRVVDEMLQTLLALGMR